jgi:purine-binding chemotaxis protein CheW
MNYDIDEVIEEIDFPWLIFKLSNNMYTVNSKMITSIVIKPEEVTLVPNVKDYIDGLIHLRGNVVPLIDLKRLFNVETEDISATKENKMVVVLEKDNSYAGLIVDEVLSVESITAFEETEEIKKMCREGFVKGVAKGNKSEDVLLIIDEEKILNMA